MKLARVKSAIKLFIRGYNEYKYQIVLLSVLGFVSGLLEGVGVNAIIPLFSFISKGSGQATDLISRAIAKLFYVLHISYNLKFLLVFICLLFIAKALSIIIFNYINIKITSDYEKRNRSMLLKNTLLADWPYLIKHKIGYLEQVLITDVSRSAALLRQLASTILLVTNLIMYLAVALNISLLITSLTLVIGIVLFLFFKPMFHRARMISKQQADVTKQAANLINENMIGAKTVKAADKAQEVIAKADEHFEILKTTGIRVSFLSSVNNSLIEPVGIFFIVGMFAISYKLPSFSFASFAVIIYLIQRIFSYLQTAQNRVQTISEYTPYLSSVISYQEEALAHKEPSAGGRSFAFRDVLEFRDVSFAYHENQPVLSQLNFRVKKGQLVGIIGPSGAGKTTIVDLVLRLFSPRAGAILLDGVNIREIRLQDWRKKISYVPQDIFLLNDTIANNIRFYNPEITKPQLEEAARLANLYNFVMEQPQKFETLVGERGSQLSGGQRQRVSLARALATNPEILILDEATSALDNESEALIQKAIEKLKGKITVLVIAHRLSTIQNCDKLLALEKGKIVEEGPAAKLLQNKDSYFYKISKIR